MRLVSRTPICLTSAQRVLLRARTTLVRRRIRSNSFRIYEYYEYEY